MDNNMKKMIMIEHYQNPHNKEKIENDKYLKSNINTPTCIDNLNFNLLLEDGIIKDIKFDGEACAISTSSSSIMTDLLIGKKVDEAKEIINNFEKMLKEEEYDRNVLEEANCYDEIYKQPNRIKCASLPYDGIKKIIERVEKNGN